MKKTYILLLLFFHNCYLIPCTFNSDLDEIDTPITTKVLSGTYHVEQRTIDYVDNYKNGDASITLNEDGTMTYTNITEQTINIIKLEDRLLSGEGVWELKESEVYLKIESSISYWKIFKKNDNYIISILYGDPDSCLFVRFIKSKS